eukprot:1268023-Alexandrium_andersonii.AAC.1
MSGSSKTEAHTAYATDEHQVTAWKSASLRRRLSWSGSPGGGTWRLRQRRPNQRRAAHWMASAAGRSL